MTALRVALVYRWDKDDFARRAQLERAGRAISPVDAAASALAEPLHIDGHSVGMEKLARDMALKARAAAYHGSSLAVVIARVARRCSKSSFTACRGVGLQAREYSLDRMRDGPFARLAKGECE